MDFLANPLRSLICIILSLSFISILTFSISTIRFFTNARSKTLGRTPPTAPFWIPGFYHLFQVLLGPAKHFSTLINRYGKTAPFFCRMGPVSVLIITDPVHIKRVLQCSKQMTIKWFHHQVFGTVFAVPQNALALYATDKSLAFVHGDLNRRYFSGTNLSALTETYVSCLRKKLLHIQFSDNWTEIEDLWSFFHEHITGAIIETLLGTSILEQYPDMVQQFWTFVDQMQSYSSDPLRQTIRFNQHAARTRILENLKKWILSNRDREKKTAPEDPAWNCNTGSKYIQHRERMFEEIFQCVPDENIDARASEMLGVLVGAIANTIPSTFWYIFEALRNHTLRQQLERMLKTTPDTPTSTTHITELCSNPLLLSMQAEVARFRLRTAIFREAEHDDFPLDADYTIPKGTITVAFPHHLAFDRAAWEKCRPSTVGRPLEEFWAGRFLVREEKSAQEEKCKTHERFSLEGLSAVNFPFGGGQNVCPGRLYAKNIQIATLAVFLNEYDVELVDRMVEKLMPPILDAAVGTVEPLGCVGVRIRRRDGWYDEKY